MPTDKRLLKHWKTVRPSKSNPDHLSHAHLLDVEASEKAGKDVYLSPRVKIANVSIGLIKSLESPNGDDMIFLHFEGQSKKLGLNSTNSKTMQSLSGSAAPIRWIGLTIQLYVDPSARYPKGEKGPAIRIKPTLPRGADVAPMPEPRPEDVERLEAVKDARVEGDREPGEEG
jgi:hypothetical protein